MKILAINGSHRGANGYTSFLLKKMEAGAKSANADFKIIELSTCKLNRCIACSKCQTPEHHKQGVFDGKDDALEIIESIEACDVLILASPVYVFNISSSLKILLERYYSKGSSDKLEVTQSGLMFHDVNEKLKHKQFMALVVSNNMECATTEASEVFFRNFARFMDLNYLGTIKRSSGKLAGYGKDKALEARFPIINEVYSELENIGMQLAITGSVKRSSINKASKLLIPVPFFRQLMKIPFMKQKINKRAVNYA